MSYHLDKRSRENKAKKNRFIFIAILIIILLILSPRIWRGFSSASSFIGIPVWKFESFISQKFSGINYFFSSKKSLSKENELLKEENQTLKTKMADYDLVKNDITNLQNIFGRINANEYTMGIVLSGPRQFLYDALIIDIGEKDGVKVGEKVFSEGIVLVGEIAEVYPQSSKVKLYSAPGEKIDVMLASGDIPATLTGRGGGNFEMTISREVEIKEGEEVYVPNLQNEVIAVVGKVIFDPRDPFQKVLLTGVVNYNALTHVQILKTK
jgi:cell shape-determining protein MreC